MRSKAFPIRRLVISLALASLAVGAVGAGGCEAALEIDNAAPRVTFFAAAPASGGVVDLTVWILDLDGEPVDLEVSFVVDGGQDQTPVWAPGGHGTTGLTTEGGLFQDGGQPHLLRWKVSDLDPTASVRVTLVPDDLLDRGQTATSPAFILETGLDGAVEL